MNIEIRRTNNRELEMRRDTLTKRLFSAIADDGAPDFSLEDVREMSASGMMSVEERKLYDELRRVELLLGE
ncbi:hypothetical protein [Corynebacterium vitaeruminis]|uniref:Uncharacterized protein n=1 Tax=Corynebacterium vitaeruminis DSM 20294 TaxID=1224164 RepID=W5Y072_9CORY|nr:hypothetical protein [Corynebacterium vitaeruminis]AHI22641.1 hypothetical protein B843_06280 [Corynebacterium vitaeruminis DSM 20294]